MSYFRNIAIAALVVVGAAILVFYTTQSRRSKTWGFKDAVKNPRAFLTGFDNERDEDLARAVDEAKAWSASEVATKVRWFVLEIAVAREARHEGRVLTALGAPTQTAVLALMNDPSLRGRLATPTGENLLPETPFERACELLGESPPSEAISAVAPFLHDKDDGVRKQAALVLGQTGHVDAAPSLRTAFADEDEYVRFYAMRGLERARRNARLSPDLASSLFVDVQGLVVAGKNAGDASGLLLHLDRPKALEFLLSDAVFVADSPVLHEIIEALTKAEITVPREKLESVINALKDMAPLDHPRPYLLGEALHALGRHEQAEDRPLLHSKLSHPDLTVAEGASAGLVASHGLAGFEQRMWDKEEASGYDALTIPQRHYSAISMCDAEINNGGISQFFFNSSGDRWKDALAGFEAIGANERAAILREAITAFGRAGPSEDRKTRMDQLSGLYRKNDKIFDALDSRYYASKESLSVATTRYVLSNLEAFR